MSESILASLSLFVATPEQILVSRKRTYPHWGRGLTEAQYLTRDFQLDKLEHATNGKFITWVLAPRDEPNTVDFKCACETYQRKVLIKRPGAVSLESAVGYSIASVFTPPKNRRKGYARHMTRLLHWVIAPHRLLPPFPESWGSPPALVKGCGNAMFSALYSDIGDFYQFSGPAEISQGWIIRDPISTVWDVSNFKSDQVAEVDWLDEPGVKVLWKKDAQLMYSDMENSVSKKTLFTYLPDEGVANFLLRRTLYFLPGLSYRMPTKWGASLSNNDNSGTALQPTFATWTLDVSPPPETLIVTRIRATEGSFPKILTAAMLAAQENGMKKVEIWNLPKDLQEVAHGLGGVTETRDEHLNAFKWYGPEKNEDIEWLYNEKFCWC